MATLITTKGEILTISPLLKRKIDGKVQLSNGGYTVTEPSTSKEYNRLASQLVGKKLYGNLVFHNEGEKL